MASGPTTHLQFLDGQSQFRFLHINVGQGLLTEAELIAQRFLLLLRGVQTLLRLLVPGAYILNLAFTLVPFLAGLLQQGVLGDQR